MQKMGFYKDIIHEEKTRENIDLLMGVAGDLMTKDMEGAKLY